MTETNVTGWRPVVALLPVFLATRLFIFFALTSATDYQVYYLYGKTARNGSLAALYKEHSIEYPQLAVCFGAGVDWIADQLPDGVERLISARPNPAPSVGAARYQVALGLVLFGIDTVLFFLVALLARQLDPDNRVLQMWRLGLYVAATTALGPVLYDRLDLIVGASALFALLALGRGWSIVAYGVLTLGVGFKLVPAVLFPVFVVGAAAHGGERFWRNFLREGIIATVIFAAWPLLTYQFGGEDRAFSFMKYHTQRGVEVGSLYSAPLLLGHESTVGFAFGSYVVRGSTADAVAQASPAAVLLALALAFLVVLRAVRRAPAEDRTSVIAASCVLVWLAFILTNKVGSPQYFLWLAPLVPLMPLRAPELRRWGIWYCVTALLATLMYPYLWANVFGAPVPEQLNTWAGPNALGFVVLFIRWAAVVVVTVWLAVWLWHFPQSGSIPTPRSEHET
jgi:hypothetical protein